jgi:hypothetical protein
MFEGACRILSEAASAAGGLPPLVVMPDGGGARSFSNRAESERTRLGALLPVGCDPGSGHSVSAPSVTAVILETGEQLDPAVFTAALYYLRVRYHSSLTVWDVVNDPLLRGSAMAHSQGSASP